MKKKISLPFEKYILFFFFASSCLVYSISILFVVIIEMIGTGFLFQEKKTLKKKYI